MSGKEIISSGSDEEAANYEALLNSDTTLESTSKVNAQEDMSEYETIDSESSDSDEQTTSYKALQYPDTSLELERKLKRQNLARPPCVPPTSLNGKFTPQQARPWESKPGNTPPPKDINILLLGESGVGKSTFINSFANYMKHENFEAVQQNNLRVLIPARFHIFDKDFKKHLIEIGANDENEYLADGAAATQDVKTYVFYVTIENVTYQIRLIDTPGMGDPRGIAQDNKNCDYVLNYLGRLEKVHAICLLLKPTNTRLDVFLNYCITQILSRLEKSATDNIAFLFTNTRGQNYTPGDTYTSLELLVKKIKDTNNVSLPLSKNNVFCFDNEAFRFLAAIKQGVEFRDGILEANVESWKYSYNEVYRLLSYIVKLKPHDPKKTISINHARKMVLQLAQPLAEIVQLIGDNIYELDQHTNQLLMENQTLEELKQKLYMPVIDIKVKELPQPVTVCTAPNCSEVHKVGGRNKFHYKQRCHNPCYLNNVPAEIVGDPSLLKCWAITNQVCRICNCRFNTHMHIYYETETFENKIVDENVMRNINTKEDATKEKQRMINKILNHKEDLEKEHKYIIKCTAAFAHFLQQNAITPINDSLKEYIKYLITREENLGPSATAATLDYLRRLLAEYEQEKNVLEEALKYDTATNGVFDNSPSAIEKKIRELFTLRYFGKKIKELYDLHQSGGITEHKQSEFVVKEMYHLSIFDKCKAFGGSVMNALGFRNSNPKNKNDKVSFEVDKQQKFYAMQGIPYDMQQYPGYFNKNDQFSFGPPGNPQYWSEDQARQYNYWQNFQRYCSPSEDAHQRKFGHQVRNYVTLENMGSPNISAHDNDEYNSEERNNGTPNKSTTGKKNKKGGKKQQKAIDFPDYTYFDKAEYRSKMQSIKGIQGKFVDEKLENYSSESRITTNNSMGDIPKTAKNKKKKKGKNKNN